MDKEFDEIYRLYAADVYRFVLKLSQNEAVAMDILQDTMLKAITSIDKFKGECSMKTYLCTIARNEYLNHRKRADNLSLPLDAAGHAASDAQGTAIMNTRLYSTYEVSSRPRRI